MFTAFNLTMDEKEMARLEKEAAVSEQNENENQEKVVKDLRRYLDMGADFDGEALQAACFPELQFQVFLSHAQADAPLVSRLERWLREELGVSAFVDAWVWQAADTLVAEGYAPGHVYPLLHMVFGKMIAQSECVIFLNPYHSLKKPGPVGETPWIYAELQTARMTRKKKPERFKKFHFAVTLGTQLKIAFDPQLPNLLLLNAEDLEKWYGQQQVVSEEVYHLDLLYLQKQIII
ncbi:toll/interleukin-1 receptor domain-containing protein [Eubacterium sp. 1001713B170207_170306_E7]|uniref:toll/interleukin-1 receptor domain-containing protein n=1 Tax=Eubacterium sp. 1001713B170207_170306_E7 TaxID=2787097 RepID=UPI00189B8F0A|nr:toll/interleukin-1 receptor domain-containing protein [Eubacterium sp. 1001713B170207_170306_E7]